MKKFLILLMISICSIFVSCTKSCYCKAPGSSVTEEYEVTFNEDCKSLSNSSRGECSS